MQEPTMKEIVKLYKVPKGSKIRVDTVEGEKMSTFHHLDGMYSFCTIDGVDESDGIFHLSATTPLVLGDDGVYSIAE